MRQNGKLLILVLLVCMLVSGSACVDAAETNTPGSDNASSYFEEYIDHPLFIASRGIFPETIDQEWENSVSKCWLSISTEKSLVEFDPSVDSIGGGELLEVYLSSSYQGKINESKIDEIYQRIDEYCEQEAGISEIPVVFMWAEDEEDLPLPDYGPEILEKARNSSSVIAVYGTIPVIEKESEKRAWTDRLGHSKEREVSPYFAEFGGPVLSYGVSINGYLFVGMDLESPEKVNDSIINEIYQAIESHFEQEADITDVPVVFRWEDRVVLCLAADDNTSDGNIIVRDDDGNLINYSKDEAYYDEDGNLVIVGNETTQGETGTSNKAPGFTSIMLIIGLFLLAMSRK